jgi:lipopolysaccharide heptosyltransferase II
MGDVIMSSPAIRALKESFHCSITLMTSSMGSSIARMIPEIDDVIVFDVPWVKLQSSDVNTASDVRNMVQILKSQRFDAAIIFTVYSQSPLPAALLLYLADVPMRLAYCRENPYQLLTHWLPDEEPYTLIRHQVKRDLALVKSIGASVSDDHIRLDLPEYAWTATKEKLRKEGIDVTKPWIILHPGVSEKKREYPEEHWAAIAHKITGMQEFQVIITGTQSEAPLAARIKEAVEEPVYSLAGLLSVEEFVMLIKHASLVISVNTSTIHIAAATQTRVIVLYALTNPQHTPWKVPGTVLPYDVPESMQSKNEIIRYVHEHYFNNQQASASPDDVMSAVEALLNSEDTALSLAN